LLPLPLMLLWYKVDTPLKLLLCNNIEVGKVKVKLCLCLINYAIRHESIRGNMWQVLHKIQNFVFVPKCFITRQYIDI
jgi:hypothetical protein